MGQSYEFGSIQGSWKLVHVCDGDIDDSCSKTQRDLSVYNRSSFGSGDVNEWEDAFIKKANTTYGFSSGPISIRSKLELSSAERNLITQNLISSLDTSADEWILECPAKKDAHAIYKWVTTSTVNKTDINGDTENIEAVVDSTIFWCVSDKGLEPQCAFTRCADIDCQVCGEFGDDNIVSPEWLSQ
eukprot:181976_1